MWLPTSLHIAGVPQPSRAVISRRTSCRSTAMRVQSVSVDEIAWLAFYGLIVFRQW
jgi:hypothetical protein